MKVQSTFKITLTEEELKAIAVYLQGSGYTVNGPEVMVTSEGLLFGHDKAIYYPDENQNMPERVFDESPINGELTTADGEGDLPF